MKKIFILSIVTIFFLSLTASSAFAGRRWGHGGYGYGHRHGGYGYYHGGHHGFYGWDAFAIGLGAAIVGSAIINSLEPAPAPPTIVERHPYYNSYGPTQYPDEYSENCPPPGRVWIPGRYFYTGNGHYVYEPGHWAR